mmetsp:Transcript_41339/g.86591  ORF Transcript_41339/g.86591 Transcript_41339/m.86591 type:complete len:224 (-) Transcript_41339:550-1221(-)|eukprot:6183139-Pleurochrysis_carterae.AAC.2
MGTCCSTTNDIAKQDILPAQSRTQDGNVVLKHTVPDISAKIKKTASNAQCSAADTMYSLDTLDTTREWMEEIFYMSPRLELRSQRSSLRGSNSTSETKIVAIEPARNQQPQGGSVVLSHAAVPNISQKLKLAASAARQREDLQQERGSSTGSFDKLDTTREFFQGVLPTSRRASSPERSRSSSRRSSTRLSLSRRHRRALSHEGNGLDATLLGYPTETVLESA